MQGWEVYVEEPVCHPQSKSEAYFKRKSVHTQPRTPIKLQTFLLENLGSYALIIVEWKMWYGILLIRDGSFLKLFSKCSRLLAKI